MSDYNHNLQKMAYSAVWNTAKSIAPFLDKQGNPIDEWSKRHVQGELEDLAKQCDELDKLSPVSRMGTVAMGMLPSAIEVVAKR